MRILIVLGLLSVRGGGPVPGLESSPDHAGCHYGPARAMLLRSDWTEAVELLKMAVSADPGWKEAREFSAPQST